MTGRDRENVKIALKKCENMSENCVYEVDQTCPYADPHKKCVCDRRKLMRNSRERIEELESQLKEANARIGKAQEALCGPIDSEYCNYDCDVPAGE